MIFGRGRRRGDVSDFQQALRRSLRAAVEGDPARAQTWLERAVELDSADFDAYQALARLYRDRGEIGRAIRMHQNLLLRTDLAEDERLLARLELARDLEAGGFLERACAGYEELLAERPRDPEILAALASLAIGRGEAERSEALVARLRRLDAARADALEQRMNGRWPERRHARRRGGLVSRFVTGLGGHRHEDRIEQALRARLERGANDAPARLELARHVLARGRREEARTLLVHGLELAADSIPLHVALGRLLLEEGRVEEALAAYGRLLDALAPTEALPTSDASASAGTQGGRAGDEEGSAPGIGSPARRGRGAGS